MTQKEMWDNWKAPDTIEECVLQFFAILDAKEETDSGREFHPTYISTIRVWDSHRLGKLIPRMKELCTSQTPTHGGKITCELCNGFIQEKFRYKKIGNRYQHMEEPCSGNTILSGT